MRQTIYAAVLVAIAAVASLWFLANFERMETRVVTDYRGEARYNDFLAARMLLSELGTDSASRHILDPSEWLPPLEDTLVTRITPSLGSLDDGQSPLAEWVEDGGHLLLLAPERRSSATDAVLAPFDLALVPIAIDADDSYTEQTTVLSADDVAYRLDLETSDQRIGARDDRGDVVVLSDEKGIVVSRQRHGQGFVTLVADGGLFTNSELNLEDHARLLLDLAAGSVEPGKVWVVYDAAVTSFWRLIWQAAPYAIVSCCALFLAWLWSRMPRFGPRLELLEPTRRSIIEHIGAAGRLAWRQRAQAALAEASVEAILSKAERVYPGVKRLSREQQAATIARITERDPDEVLNALHASDEHRPREFTEHIRELQAIRKRL